MLVKLLHDDEGKIRILSLPTSLVPIKTVQFTHNFGHGRSAKLEQFPVTLAYSITDYKSQGKTFQNVVVDLKKPSGPGASAPSSAYVQLSRATALTQVSIMRPFIGAEQSLADGLDKDLRWAELEAPLPIELEEELKWQEEMDERTLCMVQAAT
jgi:hypothetical protein